MNSHQIALFFKKFLKFWKKRSLLLIFILILVYFCFFLISPFLLNYLQKEYTQKFVFYSITEPIVSLLKFSFALTFITLFPLLWYGVISFFDFVYSLKTKRYFYLFYFLGLFLFYLGNIFAYKITFPYGIKFLISFGTEKIKPAISLGHFVNFFCFFIIVFGLIFELPLFMCFLSLTKVIDPLKLKKYRKEIFFFIIVIAAIITPTPDAFNMMLLACPLYLLFELGLILAEKFQKFNIP